MRLSLFGSTPRNEAWSEADIDLLAAFDDAQSLSLLDMIGIENRLAVLHKANPVSQLLAEIPAVGLIGAITMALTREPGNFGSGRHFAAWLGLTPKEHSIGGKQRMGKISKAGNERLRQLLVAGATSVIRFAKPGSKSASA